VTKSLTAYAEPSIEVTNMPDVFREWRSDPGFARYLSESETRRVEWESTRERIWSGEYIYHDREDLLAFIPQQPADYTNRLIEGFHSGDLTFGGAARLIGIDRFVFDILYRRWLRQRGLIARTDCG
jgi:hypothetical protein